MASPARRNLTALRAVKRAERRRNDTCASRALRRAECVVDRLPSDAVPRVAYWRRAAPRHLTIYLAVVAGNVGHRALARVSGAHPKSIHRVLRRVEDARDRPEVDAALTHLEERFHEAAV